MKPVDKPLVPMTVNIGGQLDDVEIIGRDIAVQDIFDYLVRGMNLTINDPRRIGKSAVLQLLESASSRKITVVKTSVQKIHTLEHFLVHLLSVLNDRQSLPKRLRKNVGDIVDSTGLGIELGGMEYNLTLKRRHGHKAPLDLLTELVASLHQSLADDELLVLAVDEFTESIINIASHPEDGRRQATQLLQVLQTLRKDHPRVRWILTGSIGMHHAIRFTDCTSAVISGDCKNITIGPLGNADATFLSRCLSLGEHIELTEKAHAYLVDAINGIPILVHAVVDVLRKKPSGVPFTIDDVESAIAQHIDDPDESRTFEHFVTRLQTYYTADERPIARALLDRAAGRDKPYKTESLVGYVAKKLDVSEEAVRQVRRMVIDDHYLVNDGDRMRWRYPILARIWKAKR